MPARPHTGRRRNEAGRRAILDATLRLLRKRGTDALTIEAIAREADVSRQTIYRWWPSRAAILYEAASRTASEIVPSAPDTGSLREDLRAFLRATYEGAARPEITPVLRALASESLRDEQSAAALREFTAERRAALRALFERHGTRRRHAELLVDLAYGLLWYRVIVAHQPLDSHAADAVAEALTNGR